MNRVKEPLSLLLCNLIKGGLLHQYQYKYESLLGRGHNSFDLIIYLTNPELMTLDARKQIVQRYTCSTRPVKKY